MKKAILTLAVAILALSTASFAANRPYNAVTNDDNPNGNTATTFTWNGTTLAVNQTLHTGGTGSGGGYFANSRINLLDNNSCLFIADAGSADIAGFALTATNPLTFNTTPVRTPSGGPVGSALGTGLISTPDGKLLIASLGENFELAVFTVQSNCGLTSVKTLSFNDEAGPMGITNDGKVLIVPEPNNGVMDAYTVTETSPYLTPLGTPVNLNSSSSCSVGCFPTGVDISNVSGGKATVVAGNATLSGPYYITVALTESTGLSQSSASTFLVTNTGNENLESPYYSSAGIKGNGLIYMGFAGFGGVSAGEPGGVSANKVTAGAISSAALGSFTNNSAVYCTNVEGTATSRTTQTSEYLWQGIVDENFNNDMYIYKVNGGGQITSVTSIPNPNAQGGVTFVLTLSTLPGGLRR